MINSTIALAIGFILDLIFGDPYWLPHPIRFIGNLISNGEKLIRGNKEKSAERQRVEGVILAVSVIVISTIIPIIILVAARMINNYLGLAIESFMCYQILATKGLKTESMKVYKKLAEEDLEGARYAVSMIVGRDTKALDEAGVAKAAVETVAENTSDGIIAPMIFMAIGGAPLGFLYKAINTLDSMIGYKNDKYLNFGRFAAKLDDIANFIPARISAYLMIFASFILGFNYKGAYKIYSRDKYNHASPNSAHTESVCAGALNVQLAGNAYYFGKLYEKPTIGDDLRPINYDDIKKANKLLYATAFICLAAVEIIKWAIIVIS